MKIFKDVFTGDELFSDTYKMKLVDDVIYEVYGKHETRTLGDVTIDGANASAEEGGDDLETASESGVDIILNHRLVESGFKDKKQYLDYLKDYMKKVVKYLEDNDRKGEVDAFKKGINGAMKAILGKFKELQFFTGESINPEAMIAICMYKDVDGEERPVLMFFKHGLEEEKC